MTVGQWGKGFDESSQFSITLIVYRHSIEKEDSSCGVTLWLRMVVPRHEERLPIPEQSDCENRPFRAQRSIQSECSIDPRYTGLGGPPCPALAHHVSSRY